MVSSWWVNQFPEALLVWAFGRGFNTDNVLHLVVEPAGVQAFVNER